jgi:heptose-I-phosphate ethanolaminephosphotransferase
MTCADWRPVGRSFLFFWYFSAVCHALLMFSGATGFFPFRQGVIFSLIWLIPVLLFPGKTRAIAAAVGLFLWVASLINLGYFAIYRQEFSQSVLFIVFESNPAEASEYIDQYLKWWMLPALIAYSLSAFWLWRGLRNTTLSPSWRYGLGVVIVAILVLPPIAKVTRKHAFTANTVTAAFINRLEPVVPWQFVIGYIHYQEQLSNMQSLRREAQRIPPIANLADARAGLPGTLVLVIGESTNRTHMSLYGYSRKTSPTLEAMGKDITVFSQVYASRPYTIEALQQMLTFADQESPSRYLTDPSLMGIMKQAGYRTYWITNQQTLTKRNTMLTNFSEQMDEQYYLNHQRSQNAYSFDGNVLDPLEKILGDGVQRRFIVIHLLGAHMRYKYRYPPDFDVFKDTSGLPGWVTDDHATLINEYDNALRYNDFIVSSVAGTLAAKGGASMMVYVSDHGEDVFDTPNHQFIGRNEAKPTRPMYAVPFLLWSSAEWRKQDPRRFSGEVLERPYQLSHFIHSWADLAGLHFSGFDASKSIVDPGFRARPIWVGNPDNPAGLTDLLDLKTSDGV